MILKSVRHSTSKGESDQNRILAYVQKGGTANESKLEQQQVYITCCFGAST